MPVLASRLSYEAWETGGPDGGADAARVRVDEILPRPRCACLILSEDQLAEAAVVCGVEREAEG